MRLDIEVENFQSLREVVLSVEGFVALVGPTHSGKSSLVRALSACLSNKLGSTFIKVGATSTEVHLKYIYKNQLVDWTWVKSDSASIILNGKKYTKLNREIPTELLTSVGFAPIEIEGKRFRPHFAFQLSELFALGESGTTLFNLILSLSSYEKIPDVKKTVVSDLKIKELEMVRVEGAEFLLDERIKRSSATLGVLNSDEIVRFEDCYNQVERNNNLLRIQVVSQKLSSWLVQAVEVLFDSDKKVNLLSLVDRLSKFLERCDSLNQERDKLLVLPDLERKVLDLEDKNVSIIKWRSILQKVKILEQESVRLREVSFLIEKQQALEDDQTKLVNLKDLLRRFGVVDYSFKELKVKMKKEEDKIVQIETELALIIRCPMCNAPVHEGKYCPVEDHV